MKLVNDPARGIARTRAIHGRKSRIAGIALVATLLCVVFAGCGRAASSAGAPLSDPHGTALRLADLPGFQVTPGHGSPDVNSDACPEGSHIEDATPEVPKRCDFTSYLVDSAISGPGRRRSMIG